MYAGNTMTAADLDHQIIGTIQHWGERLADNHPGSLFPNAPREDSAIGRMALTVNGHKVRKFRPLNRRDGR